ncbi:hypothetical protein ACS126_12160 [Sphingobacterium lactis]|uniref:hypothetical protein n=1 Tax=Sphingobacterium lactis TaxID=797291 RepID=UPI003EC6424D
MTLKIVLLINAISSGITGILLALMPDIFATLFKTDKIAPFVEVGIFLILFSSFVLLAAFNEANQKRWTKLIIKLDLIWVVASIFATVFLASSIGIVGSIIILAIAAWVGLMAYFQQHTLNKLCYESNKNNIN